MIRILDNNTINKIAAGEVIEKPVNVVKELVENAIDAGSDNISVEIKGGGIDYIRVTDDGRGIPYEEVPTAFLRHATSKIVSSEDLFFLNTLGFRGEALASIASVSHTQMITKTKDELMGTKIDLDCGSVIELTKAGAPEGTTIIIRDLFFNVPARKKFLNSASSEATKIIEMMEELVLSNPSVAFQLIVNGSVKIQTNGSGNIKDVIYRIYGKEIHDALLPLDYEDDYIKITGFITKPEACRPSRSGENYFINGRYVKNDFVTRGIEEGYRNFLMQHKFPFVVLFVELDPFGIDVNVHPAKSEVRITNGEFLVDILNKTINKTLTDNELIPSAFNFKEEKKPLERAPEPFEKVYEKNTHVIQKGYDAPVPMTSKTEEDESTKPNDKSKEFTVDFENTPNVETKPNNEFMNHITTISYKSKYDKLAERMQNPDDDDDEKVSFPENETVKENIDGAERVEFERADSRVEESFREAASQAGESFERPVSRENEVKETPKNFDWMASREDALFGSVNPERAEESASQGTHGSALLKNRPGSVQLDMYGNEIYEPDNSSSSSNHGSALLKNRVPSGSTYVESQPNEGNTHGSALYKKAVPEPSFNEEVAEEKTIENKDSYETADSYSNGNASDNPDERFADNSDTLNGNSEEIKTEEIKAEETEKAAEAKGNDFEQWLNDIEHKDFSDIENGGMVVRINQEEKVNAVKKDDSNDAFNDFDLEKKTRIIDNLGENNLSDEERLKNADKKYSVLNDEITPIESDDTYEVSKDQRFSFRVKDFSKADDEEELSPIKENVDNIFKKADRFKDTTHREVRKETQSVLFNEKTFDPSKLSKFKVIDQVFDTYWLILADSELLIMDQHAAHEKVLYEKFMEKFRNDKIETQTLMISQVVNLSKSEMDVYLRYKKEFEKFGFIINDFGDRDLFIRGIPTDLFGSDAKSLFLDILSELINVSPSLHIEIIETRIATRACKAAIKGNQKISKDDCKKLIEYMMTLKNPYQCPHGRPTLIRISQTDLEKMFKRIVS